MANPIKYTDLFDKGLQSRVESLTSAIRSTDEALTQMMDNAKSRAGVLSQALSGANPGTPGGQQEIVNLTKQIEQLVSRYDKLATAKEKVANAEKKLKVATEEEIVSREMAKQATREYNNQVRADIATMKLDEEQRKRLSNAAELQKMSYNELSQAYTQLVALANSMHASNEQEVRDRQQIIQTAAMVREEQKRLKEAMGNYTLSVGNYEKAFNGLDLAMQQIVRETPTITMGARMYFMAISNNLPILTDQIKRIRDHNKVIEENVKAMRQQGEAVADIRAKQAEAIPVGQALMKSLLSWQTLMILGITLLTQYGDKIIDWVSNAFSAEGATRAWKEAQEDLNKTIDDANISAAKSITQADVLYRIATDETRSVEDRTRAGEILQKQYEEYFGNLSTEQIMLGKAAQAHDALTESLMREARARAYLDKLVELYGKEYEQMKDLAETIGSGPKWWERLLAELRAPGQTPNVDMVYDDLEKIHDARVEASSNSLAATREEIKDLIKLIEASDLDFLLGDGTPKNSKREEELKRILDIELENIKYINDARKRELENIQDDYQREVFLTRWKYEQEIIELQKFASEQTDIYSRLNNMIQRSFGISYEKWSSTGAAMNSMFNGNVDLTNRPQIDASKLSAKGWSDAGQGTATVFSSQYGILDARGNEREILVTPILPDGSVLSPKELEDYVFDVLSGADDILAADSKGIVIAVDVDPDGSAGEKLHLMQEQYYTFVESLRDMSVEQKNAIVENINSLASQLKVSGDGIEAIGRLITTISAEEVEALSTIDRKNQQKGVDDQLKAVDDELKLRKLRIENSEETEERIQELQLLAEIDAWEERLRIMEQNANLYSNIEIAIVREMLEKAKKEWADYREDQEKSGNLLEKLFGKDYNKFLRGLERVLKMTANNIKEIISLYEEMAEAAVKAAEAQVSAAERVYEAELNAYENGYANNVEFARKELELRRNQLAEAQAEQEKYARMQEQVDSLTQISSMITAAANLFKSTSGAGPIGVAVAVAAIAAMFASFAAAKIQARQLAGASKQYGEGGTEYIGYGGTHASGNDVDFGTMPDGRPRRIERGETVAVINAKQTSKYGYSTVSDIIDSINKGEFVERYMTAFSGADGEFTMNMSSSFDSPYLSDISRDLKAIRKGGEYSESVMADGSRIVRYKNYTRRIRP